MAMQSLAPKSSAVTSLDSQLEVDAFEAQNRVSNVHILVETVTFMIRDARANAGRFGPAADVARLALIENVMDVLFEMNGDAKSLLNKVCTAIEEGH